MQEIFKFLQQYWQVVLGAILFVVSLIIAIIRKKPLSSIFGDLYQLCVYAINETEAAYKDGLVDKGEAKLLYALNIVKEALLEKYPNVNFKTYQMSVILIIQSILTTPQKKGE